MRRAIRNDSTVSVLTCIVKETRQHTAQFVRDTQRGLVSHRRLAPGPTPANGITYKLQHPHTMLTPCLLRTHIFSHVDVSLVRRGLTGRRRCGNTHPCRFANDVLLKAGQTRRSFMQVFGKILLIATPIP